MSPKPKGSDPHYVFAVRHYEFVSREFADYFRMYMQSWTIVGSAILVGVIFGLGRGQTPGNLRPVLLSLSPIILLLWFLLTTWFWAYFKMYRDYLDNLEDRMQTEFEEESTPTLYSKYQKYWFRKEAMMEFLAGLIGLLVYVGLSWPASTSIAEIFHGKPEEFCLAFSYFIIYSVVGLVSVIAAYKFVEKKPAHRSGSP